MKYSGILVVLTLVVGNAVADPRRVSTLAMDDVPTASLVDPTPVDSGPAAPKDTTRHHAIYVEALGKGGIYGVGYEHTLGRRFGIGGVASFTMLGGQRMYSLTPYFLAYPVRGAHHGWFVDAGPSLVRIATPSPVPEWTGKTENGIGAELSSGYEYRNHFLFRIYAQLIGGKSGFAPWGGVSIGWTL